MVTRYPLFWILVGAGGYWAVQHFSGFGNTGKAKQKTTG
jgi:hypothetical protein